MKIGDTYKIVVQVNERLLTYTGTITEIDEVFISFTDKFGSKYSYNKNTLISFEEIKND